MSYYYLFYPKGANQDPPGKQGLTHLLEHYIINYLQEKVQGEEMRSIFGCTGHIYMSLAWKGTNPIFFKEKVKKKDFFHLKFSRSILDQAKKEVIQEIDYFKQSTNNYKAFLRQLTNRKVFPPLGKKSAISSISIEEIQEHYKNLPKPSLYIYDIQKQDFTFISTIKRDFVKLEQIDKKKPQIIKKGDDWNICFPDIILEEKARATQVLGLCKELYIYGLHSRISEGKIKQNKDPSKSYLIDYDLSYYCLRLGKFMNDTNAKDFYFNWTQDNFKELKNIFIENVKNLNQKAANFYEVFQEVISREIYYERRFFSSKTTVLEDLSSLSWINFQTYLQSLGILALEGIEH